MKKLLIPLFAIFLIFSLISNSEATKAKRIKIEDAGSYYTSETVEGALQEAGAAGGIDWTNTNSNLLTTGDISLGADNSTLYLGASQDSSVYFDGADLILKDANAGAKTLSSLVSGSQLTQEQVDDYVDELLKDADSVHTFISLTYDDANDAFDFIVPVKDEDNMISDSDTHLATQQSIKAYVDTQDAAQDACSEITSCVPDAYDAIGDLPTAVVSNGDTTHISTADQIYDFVAGGYQPLDADLTDLADGTLSKSKVEDSVNWDNAYTHSQITTGNPHNLDYVDIGLSSAQVLDWTNASNNFLTTGSISVDSNSSRLYLGAGQDASIYYDGTNLYLQSPSAGHKTLSALAGGSGDMLKSTYDSDTDNIVDNAENVTCTGCVADGELATDFISETELDSLSELDAQIGITGTASSSTFLRGDNSWATPTGSGNVNASSNMADNTLIRGDGGTTGIQDSGITIDDSNNVIIPGTLEVSTGSITMDVNTAGAILLSGGSTFGATIVTGDLTFDASGVATVDESGVDHDSLANFVSNEHLDWTADLGAVNIHTGNYADTNTDTQDLSYDAGTDVISLVDGGSIDISEVDTDTNLTQEEVDDFVNFLIKDADSVHTRITITYDDTNDAFDFVVDDMNDDVPDAGDFGAATDLDANGALNTGSVSDNEIDYANVTLADFDYQTAWRVFYSNTDGDVTELALGADGTYLKSNGAAAAPTFEAPAGSGDITDVFDCATGDCKTLTVGTDEYLTYGTGYVDANRFAGVTTVDATEFGYLNGLTAAIVQAGSASHDGFSDFVANEHLDWTADQGATNIHAGNYTDTDTTYVSSDFTHDDLIGFVANEHIDWTGDQGATNIHSGNYTDTNTTYTGGTNLTLDGTTFNVDDAFLKNNANDTTTGVITADALIATNGVTFNADDAAATFGAGQEASIYFDDVEDDLIAKSSTSFQFHGTGDPTIHFGAAPDATIYYDSPSLWFWTSGSGWKSLDNM